MIGPTAQSNIAAHVRALTPTMLDYGVTRNVPHATVPHATVPHNFYARTCDQFAALPECPELETMAIELRAGHQNHVARVVSDLVHVFHAAWIGFQVPGAATEQRTAPVVETDYSWKRHPTAGVWDRVLTPRWTVDTAELSGRKLAFFLAQPTLLAAEVVRRAEAARARNAAKEITGQSLVVTPPRIFLKVEAFMLETFCWLEAAGTLTTKDKE